MNVMARNGLIIITANSSTKLSKKDKLV